MTRKRKNGTYPLSRLAWERIMLYEPGKRQLALDTGYHASAISNLLHGRRGVQPKDPKAKQLAKVLKLRMSDLLTRG